MNILLLTLGARMKHRMKHVTKGYGSLLVTFVYYIIISRTTGAGVKTTTSMNSNQCLLEIKGVAFHMKLYSLRN